MEAAGAARPASPRLLIAILAGAMKVWFGTVAVAFAVVQVSTALSLYRKPASWTGDVHRISGRLAFLFSLPVAYHCLWSPGFQDTSGRVLAHSLLGCAFYGAFVSKVTIVRSKGSRTTMLNRSQPALLPTASRRALLPPTA
jgi:hypothetical protein